MKSAIVKTENIISFSYNPQKKWIEKDDLANQISLQVVNDCGWSFGLIGKEGVNYFKSYFLEIYEKTTILLISFDLIAFVKVIFWFIIFHYKSIKSTTGIGL